jgi:recombinational DNA repair protein (RecF pathway)
MAYSTYTTEALVCGTFNRNTADRSYLLFTKEAGMLFAEARSVREERSRQRFALQDFSYVRVSLIKGKSSWKIGSIESKTNYFSSATSKEARGSVVSLFRLLRRFFSGSEAAPALFEYVVAGLQLLAIETANRDVLEKILHVRLLMELGYVDNSNVPAIVESNIAEIASAHVSSETTMQIEKIIDKAVSTSHL